MHVLFCVKIKKHLTGHLLITVGGSILDLPNVPKQDNKPKLFSNVSVSVAVCKC